MYSHVAFLRLVKGARLNNVTKVKANKKNAEYETWVADSITTVIVLAVMAAMLYS